jgi:hypothetical protein
MDSQNVNRRDAVSLVGVGLASLVSGPGQAEDKSNAQSGRAATGPVRKDSPLTKYPKPPFSEQTQPWPAWPARCRQSRTMVKPATRARAA